MWNQAAVYRRRRRNLAASALLFIVLIIVVIATSGGGGPKAPPKRSASTGSTSLPQSSAPLTYTRVASLPEPARASAAAPVPGSTTAFSLLGGLASSDVGTSGIGTITAHSTQIVGTLPVSLFAAAAVTIGSHEYVFGGASGSRTKPVPELGILSYDPASGTAVTEIAHLPSDNYGCAAAVVGSTAYIVGGDNGRAPLNTIVSWHPGGNAAVVRTLPVALLYPAVAAVDGRVVIAGGLLANNTASRAIYVFDPATQTVTTLKTHLPAGIYAASGASLGKLAYVIGGATPGGTASNLVPAPVNTIYSIDPITRRVANAGTLGGGTRAEAPAVRVGNAIFVAGGLSGNQTTDAVGMLTAAG
jgi:hypothetical protein